METNNTTTTTNMDTNSGKFGTLMDQRAKTVACLLYVWSIWSTPGQSRIADRLKDIDGKKFRELLLTWNLNLGSVAYILGVEWHTFAYMFRLNEAGLTRETNIEDPKFVSHIEAYADWLWSYKLDLPYPYSVL